MSENNNAINFSSKDFEATQRLLKETAKLNTLAKNEIELRGQKSEILNQMVEDGDPTDVIQKHIDEYESIEVLEKYLTGDINNKEVQERINSFFTNDETGEILTITGENKMSEPEEFDFKRGMILYFAQSDFYLKQIDKEIEEMNKVTAELNSDISEALDPLKDNILAYAEFLEQDSKINDGDDTNTINRKKAIAKKAKAIKNGYTLGNMFELIEKHPGIIKNAVSDFRNDTKVKEIGKRYAAKLKTNKIDFNLYSLLSDDIHNSLEYRCLPLGDYPEGFENFTVFFILRAMSMGLNSKEDIVFHASVQICLNRLMEGSLDEDVAERVKESISKFLNLFI